MSDKKQTSTTPLDDKKIINGWAMFDWANSAYSLVIVSAIFPQLFPFVPAGGEGSTTLPRKQASGCRGNME